MKELGKSRSTIKPPEIELTETRVFVATNITAVSEEGTEEQPGFAGYEFDLVEYDKDECIKLQAEHGADLEQQLEDTQVALCEVYEFMS